MKHTLRSHTTAPNSLNTVSASVFDLLFTHLSWNSLAHFLFNLYTVRNQCCRSVL